jgi:dTDP-4-dehydrorhamnose 3,5-epimerase
MHFTETPIAGAVIVELDRHRDDRGDFVRVFCEKAFADAGLPFRVAQANLSFNPAPFTLRGIHFQAAPHAEAKIVSCSRGRIFDVAVDLRPSSPTYLRWHGVELSADRDRPRLFHLAEGLGHGYLTLEPETEVRYLVSSPYAPEAGSGVRWDDPAIGIDWPAAPASMSERDRGYPLLRPVRAP